MFWSLQISGKFTANCSPNPMAGKYLFLFIRVTSSLFFSWQGYCLFWSSLSPYNIIYACDAAVTKALLLAYTLPSSAHRATQQHVQKFFSPYFLLFNYLLVLGQLSAIIMLFKSNATWFEVICPQTVDCGKQYQQFTSLNCSLSFLEYHHYSTSSPA